MSIEQHLQNLTAAVQELNATMRGIAAIPETVAEPSAARTFPAIDAGAAQPPATVVPLPTATVPATAPAAGPAPASLEDTRAKLGQYVAQGKEAAAHVQNAIASMGAQRLSDLTDEQRGVLLGVLGI